LVRFLGLVVVIALAAGCSSSSSEQTVEPVPSFPDAFARRLSVEDLVPSEVCDAGDRVARRVLREYGAVFVPTELVNVMPRCVFESAEQVDRYQRELTTEAATIDGKRVDLQAEALGALEAARADAADTGLTITPRGPFPAARDFETTVELWTSRVEPALEFWREEGRISAADAEQIRLATPVDQVAAVLSLESRGIYFSTEFDRSILTSVAAPGTSQHLALLAFDVVEHDDPAVRRVLAAHGWFSTVEDDPPHFTYLGVDESDLPDRGLVKVTSDGRAYWVPDT
jgi:hypothetical protein